MRYASVIGGIKVANGSSLDFIFNGIYEQVSSPIDYIETDQYLSVGNENATDLAQKQISNFGTINFNFISGEVGKDRSYTLSSSGGNAGSVIVNNSGSSMGFNLNPRTTLSLQAGVLNNGGEIHFLIDSANLSTQSNQSGIVNQGGKIVFDIMGDEGEIVSDSGAGSGGITTKSGATTIFNIKDGALLGVDASLYNENGGITTINIDNAKRTQISPNALVSNNNQQAEFVFNIKNNSSVLIGASEMRNLKLDFQTENNEVFFANFLSQMVWLNNSSNASNFVSLGAFTNTLLCRDYWVYRNDFKVLEIGAKGDKSGITGISDHNLNFVVYANLEAKSQKIGDDGWTPSYQDNKIPLIDDTKTPTIGGQELQGTYAYSDRVIIHSSQGNKGGVHNLGVVFSYWDYANLSSISYNGGDIKTEGNIAVASVSNDSKVTLNPTEIVVGFNSILPSFEKVQTNDQGIIQANSQDNTYTTYFLSSARDMGVASATQEVTSSVFALNYDLFLANFNSLNKRMGDLRDNPYSQGAWGRIFNGQLSNDFGLGSQNNYTTLQAGYDYDFGLENARNYLGVAFSYGFSISEMSSNAKDALQSREIKDIFSNSIELALYNAYVSDNGLYSDSIAKFSYLMSDFNLTNNSTTESLSVNNYALSLSEEVGYVFTLGESKEWSITPQAELGIGYYSSSDLTQVAGEFYLDAKADFLLMFRARVGSMVGYDFKQFTQGKDIQASLYAGLSYEFDYLNGGDIELTPNVGEKTLTKSALSSDGRGVLNIGTNLAIKDNTRLYVDFQTSFGGKINTDYQINIGARFSFGEKQEKKITTLELPLKPTEG